MSSSFSPTQAEVSLANQIFTQHDTQKLGIITGDVAVRVFGGAKLQPTVLGEIWSIADEENNGWLSRKGVSIALRLIGWAQKGEKVTPELVSKPGPLAVIEGISPIAVHNTGMSIPRSPPPMSSLPPFTPQDRTKFVNMFMKYGPKDGLLSGEQARDIFVKSRLPNEKLLQIWNLADTQNRGTLDSTDFAIGMYLIQGVMSGQIPVIPASLPPSLYAQAAGGAPSSVRTHATGNSGSFSPSQGSFAQNRGHVQPQYTGQSQMLQPQSTGMSAMKKPPVPPSLPARRTNPSAIGTNAFGVSQSNGALPHWDVTAADKASSDSFFDTLDTGKLGYIEGEVAVPFMLESKLPGEVLAQVWDLADLNNDGRLTRDGFAVAMHLIQKKLAGQEIPATLPSSLIPPSMRQGGANIPASPFTSMAQQAPAPEPAKEKDLFSFDESPPPSASGSGPFNIPMQPTGSSIPMQPTGSQYPSAFASPPHFASPSVFASPTTNQDPFASAGAKDLMSDDDEPAAPLQDKSAEIGNTQNQLNSTNRSLETTKKERADHEQMLMNQAGQLSALQTQLSSAKAAYETETKLLETLRARFSTQTADIDKTRQELITAESDLSAMRVEKAEIEGAFLRDKEEARELHRRMVEAGQQAETIKGEIEKAKKDAKQQKGLLAIAKKQLSSKEAERAKAEKELLEANAEGAAVAQEKDEVESELERISNLPPTSVPTVTATAAEPVVEPAHVERTSSEDSLTFAAAHALPTTPEVPSPTGKSNNPFERLAKSDPSSPRSQSPFLPFSNVAVPSPSLPNGAAEQAAPEPSLEDPFGFSKAFETPAEASAPPEDAAAQELGTQTPKPHPATLDIESEGTMTPTTAQTEEFATPPTTAEGTPVSPVRQTTADVMAARFPDIDSVVAPSTSTAAPAPSTPDRMPGHFGEPSEDAHETDLTSSLKELEVEDSDSSDEDDEVPLAALKEKIADTTESAPTSSAAPVASDQAPSSSFDDVFGVTPANGEAAPSAATDAFGMPVKPDSESPFGVPTTSHVASPTEAGVSAFDEAMGKISSEGAPTNNPQISFDTAFDDNFDFGAASAADTSFPPAPTTNGNANAPNGSDGFDSLFVTPSQPNGSTSPATAARPVSTFLPNVTPGQSSSPPPPAQAAAPAPGPSFDEVFAGFGSGPSISLDTPAPASGSPKTSTAPVPGSPTQKPFPAAAASSQSSSPAQSSIARSASPPPRQRSPPLIRTGSPKPRPSTASSSKDGHEREKAPPARHSKLSIRLPFGKKKKQEAVPPPPPSQFLTPPIEEPPRHGSPAVEDDVEAVKQLTDMGFSRSQAVGALEKYSYDVPRALNSLLGQQ